MKIFPPSVRFLPLLAFAGCAALGWAQSGPNGTLTNDEVIEKLLAGRPRGPRALVPPPLFATLADTSSEQSAKSTPAGLAAWRDTFGKDGDDEYALRQFFVPMKTWKDKNAEQLLDDAAKQLTEAGQTILLSKKYTIDGCPCRSFILRHPSNTKLVRMDYLVVYPDLITVSYTGSPAGLQSKKVVDFFASLKTEPTGAPPPTLSKKKP